MEPEYDFSFAPYIEYITKKDPIPALYNAFPGPYELSPLLTGHVFVSLLFQCSPFLQMAA